MTKYLTYIHPSVPPSGIKVGEWNSLDDLQKRFSFEYINVFFTPSNFAIEEVLETETKPKK